jgi:hypothetical protein
MISLLTIENNFNMHQGIGFNENILKESVDSELNVKKNVLQEILLDFY